MQNLTPEGQQFVNDLSRRYHISPEAVVHMLVAVNNGGGSMAQFNCPELGGGGQWMRGGMTMVGDMFNHGLKMTVDNLCNELAAGLANMQVFPVVKPGTPGSNQWWPAGLGSPFSSGGQNNIRYAVFPNRLAVELNGQVTVYDTLNHIIGGVSQQQGGDTSLTFSSQMGTVAASSLPIVSGPGMPPALQTNFAQPQFSGTQAPPQHPGAQTQTQSNTPGNQGDFGQQNPTVVDQLPPANTNLQQPTVAAATANSSSAHDVFELIGKLASLRDAGALTDEEFNTKKTELLSRI